MSTKNPRKIGVTTFYKSSNYGAFLQCVALQEVLKKYGKISVINYQPPADIKRYSILDKTSVKSLIKSTAAIPLSLLRNINFKKAIRKIEQSNANEEYDIAITGSDQVWNPALTGGSLDPYFTLENIKAKKKISYAASIGDESIVKYKRRDYSNFISKLDRISVRENEAKIVLQGLTSKKIKVVLDPTLLLSSEEWREKTIRSNIKREYIFSYFIGITKRQNKALAEISKKTNLKVLSYSRMPKEKNILRHCYIDGPFQFISRLKNAKLVITSSFHGTAFSIIFHKNFYILLPDQKKRSRIDNILNLIGLTDRIIETEEDINKINLEDIDYTEPQKKLDKLRKESLDWLENAIEN